jgi:hypothetical protein
MVLDRSVASGLELTLVATALQRGPRRHQHDDQDDHDDDGNDDSG